MYIHVGEYFRFIIKTLELILYCLYAILIVNLFRKISKQIFMHVSVVKLSLNSTIDMPGSHANSKRSFNCLPHGC